MDAKHISIRCSKKAVSLFYNYKKFYSAVLQGVADSESIFILIDVGTYGKQSDGGTFSGSNLYHFLDNFQSTLAKPAVFEGSATFVILRNKTYPLPNEAFREK